MGFYHDENAPLETKMLGEGKESSEKAALSCEANVNTKIWMTTKSMNTLKETHVE